MTFRARLAFFLVLAGVVTASAAGERLAITPANSDIAFVGRKIVGSHGGAFEQFSGVVSLVPGDATRSSVEIAIDMRSATTDNARLSDHLRNADFFDVERFPVSIFRSTGIRPVKSEAGSHVVTGVLELRGVKKVISFPATIVVSATELRVDAVLEIDRKQFGIAYDGMADNVIRDNVEIRLALALARAAS